MSRMVRDIWTGAMQASVPAWEALVTAGEILPCPVCGDFPRMGDVTHCAEDSRRYLVCCCADSIHVESVIASTKRGGGLVDVGAVGQEWNAQVVRVRALTAWQQGHGSSSRTGDGWGRI